VTETQIVKQILAWMRLFPKKWKVWRNNNGAVPIGRTGMFRSNSTEKGIPDILFYLRDGSARFGVIEVKRPGQRLTADQKEWISKASEDNCITIVAYSLEDVQSGLKLP